MVNTKSLRHIESVSENYNRKAYSEWPFLFIFPRSKAGRKDIPLTQELNCSDHSNASIIHLSAI